ncbi:MAG: cryptochrome/photolyase family protein [Myxococcota bacterium]|nr:cryptochrome/photolyase family protein [Myxococcota bacterium]
MADAFSPGRPAFFVGPCDLNRRHACVPDDPNQGTVVFVESIEKGASLPFHKQKLVLVISALRHFAQELRKEGFEVEIVRAATYVDGIRKHVERHASSSVEALVPRDVGLEKSLRAADFGVPLRLYDDGGEGGHFLLTREEFREWAGEKDTLRMDVFYRWMRRRLNLLMDGKKPVGGKWSYDADNRKPVRGQQAPALPRYAPDAITLQVMDEVEQWSDGWGSTEGFGWPVTRADALHALNAFLEERFAHYGDFQDAMVEGERFLWHACISPALNLGLLHPSDLIEGALEAHEKGSAPLNAVEGFIRQVIGWREFIRGVYHLRMPGLREANRFGADQPLPDFFWDPNRTEMACVSDAVRGVQESGYAHHIQRLMVLGNLGLVLGIRPIELSHWFWAGFVDAHEWVELPNVHGMALAADPTFTTKPYAASGAYIHRMSNHCKGCRYKVKEKVGSDSCPFNSLFWDFMVRHRPTLSENPRIGVLYRTWDRWEEPLQNAVRQRADEFRQSLRPAAEDEVFGRWRFLDDAG